MARVGSFAPSQFYPGAPLNVIHPKNNRIPHFDPEIAARHDLSHKEKVDLQERIDELAAQLQLARDLRGD